MAHNQSQCPPGMPLKNRLMIAVYTYISNFARRTDGTVNRRLLDLLDFQAPASAKPINGVTSSDIVIDPTRELWLRLYIPSPATSSPSSTALPLLVCFHGGGFSANTAASSGQDDLCRIIARETSTVVASVNYRLAPEHRYPCQYEDGIDALKFIDEKISQNDSLFPSCSDISRCFLMGDSSGANIAHHVAVRANDCKFEKLRIVGLVCLQPFFGGEERTESELRLSNAILLNLYSTDLLWKIFLPVGANRDHEAANVTGPNAIDISAISFPPTLIIVGGYDLLQDRQRRYYEWLKSNGKKVQLVEYPNIIHAFYVFPEFPEISMAIKEIKKFIQTHGSSELLPACGRV